MITIILTDIATIALSTAGAKDERRGRRTIAEGRKSVDQGDCDENHCLDYLHYLDYLDYRDNIMMVMKI